MKWSSGFSAPVWLCVLVAHFGVVTYQDVAAQVPSSCIGFCKDRKNATKLCCQINLSATIKTRCNSSNCKCDFEPGDWLVNMVEPAPSAVPTAAYQYAGESTSPAVDEHARDRFDLARSQNLFTLKRALDGVRQGQDSSDLIRTFDSSPYLFSLNGVSDADVKELGKLLPRGVVISPKAVQATFASTGGSIEKTVASKDPMGQFVNPQQLGLRNLGGAKVKDWDGTVYRAQAGVDIGAVPGWGVDLLTGASLGRTRVVAAVIDDGFNLTDAEYLPNLYTNAREVPCNGKDDDFNGFIDDYQGWDAVLGHGCVSKGALKETLESSARQGHGTHVASILAAAMPAAQATAVPAAKGTAIPADPEKSGIGVAPMVSLLPIKAFKEELGAYDSESLVEAYRYLLTLKQQGVNVVVVNTSYTGPCEFVTDVERSAIEALVNAGITVVGAAGNNGRSNDESPMCPGNLGADPRNPNGVNGVLSVANAAPGPVANNVWAVSPSLHPWSNFGKRFVNTAAPGTVVYANREFRSGTSMATPHVSGVVALMYSVNPFITPTEVERIVSSSWTATSFGFPVMSQGLVHAERAIKAAASSVVAGVVRYNGGAVPKAIATMKAGGVTASSLTDSRGNFFFKRPAPGTPLEISVRKEDMFFETQMIENARNTSPPRLVFEGELGDGIKRASDRER